MSVWQQFLIAAAIIFSVALQFGRRRLNWIRVVLPVAIVVGFATYYLKAIPTSGNDALFTLAGLLSGLLFGALAAGLMGVKNESGRVILSTGIIYVALWVVVFGARLAFAIVATNSPATLRDLFIWTSEHGITETGWTAAFILQALAMVGLRTVVVALRAFQASRQLPAVSAA